MSDTNFLAEVNRNTGFIFKIPRVPAVLLSIAAVIAASLHPIAAVIIVMCLCAVIFGIVWRSQTAAKTLSQVTAQKSPTDANKASDVSTTRADADETHPSIEVKLDAASNDLTAKLQLETDQEFLKAQQALINQLEELTLVEEIARQLAKSVTFDQITNKMLEIALRVTAADSATLATLELEETGNMWLCTQRNNTDSAARKLYRSRGRDDGVISEILRTRKPVFIHNRQLSGLHISSPDDVNALVALPLLQADTVIGILTVESKQLEYFKDDEIHILVHLADHTVIAIENSRLLDEHSHRISVLSSLQRLSQELSGLVDTAKVEATLLEAARSLLNAQEGAIFHYDPLQQEIVTGYDHQKSPAVIPITAAQQAARAGKIEVSNQYPPMTNTLEEVPPYTIVAVPILRDDAVKAVLCIAFKEVRYLAQRDLDGLSLLAAQAGEQLEKAKLHERIRSANDRMSAILKSTRDGILLLDRDGRLVECNLAAERMLGINRDEFIDKNFVGMLFHMMDSGETEGMGYSRSQLVELARQLRAQPSRITKREFTRTSTGKSTYIEEIGSPVVDANHRISGRLLVLRDVTEQKLLTEFRSDIINMAVHDLRGPLGAIISGLRLVQENLTDPNFTHKHADMLKMLDLSIDSAENLVHLVESVLEIARLETREMPLTQTSTHVELLVRESYHALASSFTEANIRVDFLIPQDSKPTYVDRDLIRRVMINLLDNALRHTPMGGRVLVAVKPSASAPSRMVVSIADSGKGIPVSEHETVFEFFRQVKSITPLRGSKGSGLGLTFCKLAVEAHGGSIWVEQDSPLPGACIAFCLPIAGVNSTGDTVGGTIIADSAITNSAVS